MNGARRETYYMTKGDIDAILNRCKFYYVTDECHFLDGASDRIPRPACKCTCHWHDMAPNL